MNWSPLRAYEDAKDKMAKVIAYIGYGAQNGSHILGSANPLLPMPEWLLEIGQKALKDSYDIHDGHEDGMMPGTTMRYYSSRSGRGIEAFRDNVISHYAEKGVEGEFITGGSLITDLMYKTYSQHLKPGDVVLSQTPFFGQFQILADKFDAKFCPIETDEENAWKLTPEQLREGLDAAPDAKIFNFVNPINPTGQQYTETELAALAEVFVAHNEDRKAQGKTPLIVLSDEGFANTPITDIDKEFVSLGAMAGMKDFTMTMVSLSKELSPGLGVSFGIGPQWIVESLWNVTEGPSYASQAMAAAIYDPENEARIREHYMANSQIYQDNLETIKTKFDDLNTHLLGPHLKDERVIDACLDPQKGFQFTIDARGLLGAKLPDDYMNPGNPQSRYITSSVDLAYYLRDVAKLEMVPGEGFGFQGDRMLMRMTLSKKTETYETVFDQMYDALSQLEIADNRPRIGCYKGTQYAASPMQEQSAEIRRPHL